MSIYLMIMLIIMMSALVVLFLMNRKMSRELFLLKTRIVPLEIERDRQIRMGVFK